MPRSDAPLVRGLHHQPRVGSAPHVLVVDVEGSEASVLGEPLPSPKPAMVFFETSGFFVDAHGAKRLAAVRALLDRQGYVPAVLGDPEHDGWGPQKQDRNWKDDLWWLPGHPSLGLRKTSRCPAHCAREARYDASHTEPPSVPVGCACTDGAGVQCGS